MKRVSILSTVCVVLLGLLVGCLPTYVGNPEKSSIDERLVGIWHIAKDSEQLWVVHKMDSHCYLVQAYNFTTDAAGKKAIGEQMTYRAWLADIDGRKFVSLEVYDPKILIDPQSEPAKNRYAVAHLTAEVNKLTLRGVSPDFLKGKNVTTPERLEALIKDNFASKELFLDEMVYTRVNPVSPGAAAAALELLK